MNEKKRSFVMYNDYLMYFEMLHGEERGELIMAILHYVNGDNVDIDAMPVQLKMAFCFIKRRIDDDIAKYNAVCEAKQRAAKAREEKRRAAFARESTIVTDNDNVNVNGSVSVSGSGSENENENKSVSESVVVVNESVVVNENAACAGDNSSADAETTTTTHAGEKVKENSFFKAPEKEEVSEYCKANYLHVDPDKFINYYSANGWRIGKNPMRDWRAAVRVWASNEYKHGKGSCGTSSYSEPSYDFAEIERRELAKYADLM